MALYRLRHLTFVALVLISATMIIGVWSDQVALYPKATESDAQLDSVLATLIQTTSAVGGVALALIFITAQLSATKTYVLRELYRSLEVYVLLLYFVGTLLIGYFVMVVPQTVVKQELVDTVLVLATTSVVLVLPALVLQIENLSPTTLASKLANRIRPRSLVEYGLTHVEYTRDDPTRLTYSLITVGLRPKGVDPLRPIHEVLMEAVNSRDRVLFGKLFRHLLKPITVVYGASWDLDGFERGHRKPSRLALLLAKRYDPIERVHLALGILHYSVKRARNLVTEWEGRDTGRHGILTGIGDLVRSLGSVAGAEEAIAIALYATLHITEYYAAIRPFGRIEPLNYYFETANRLTIQGKRREAELCTEVLGWAAARTRQLSNERSPALYNNLFGELRFVFLGAKQRAESDAQWLPGLESEDPWRRWLD